MTANTLRGEVAIEHDGREIILRPTFSALCQIETIVGRSFFEYVQELNAAQVKLADVAAIVAACSVDPMTVDEAGEIIVAAGPIAFINTSFSELILRAAGYHPDLEASSGQDEADEAGK